MTQNRGKSVIGLHMPIPRSRLRQSLPMSCKRHSANRILLPAFRIRLSVSAGHSAANNTAACPISLNTAISATPNASRLQMRSSGSCVLLRKDAEKLSEDFSYIYVEFRNHEPLCIEKQQCSAKEQLFLESFIPVRPKPVIHRSPTSEEYSIVFNVFLLLAVLSYMGYLLVQMDPFLH